MSITEMEIFQILQILLKDLIEKGYIEERLGFSNLSAPIIYVVTKRR